MSLSCRFLQIKEVKVPVNDAYSAQNSTFSYKIKYDDDTKSLYKYFKVMVQGYGCRMSNLTICHFTLNNFNYNLLVAPSFANGGNLFVLPIFQYYIFSYYVLLSLRLRGHSHNKCFLSLSLSLSPLHSALDSDVTHNITQKYLIRYY